MVYIKTKITLNFFFFFLKKKSLTDFRFSHSKLGFKILNVKWNIHL